MARHSSHILELARHGAAARIKEIKAEIASIGKVFPHLRFGAAVSPAMPDPVEEGNRSAGPRRRPRMSAAARKAVSVRMKKYWAAKRKAKH
jgi:hypothetical protein